MLGTSYRISPDHNILSAGLSLKFLGSNEVLVTSLPSVFMEREVSEVRRGRPTVAPIIIKVPFMSLGVLSSILYCTIGHDHQTS